MKIHAAKPAFLVFCCSFILSIIPCNANGRLRHRERTRQRIQGSHENTNASKSTDCATKDDNRDGRINWIELCEDAQHCLLQNGLTQDAWDSASSSNRQEDKDSNFADNGTVANSDTCTPCSIHHGHTRWRDGRITNHTKDFLKETEDTSLDDFWNYTCPEGMECLDQTDITLNHGCCTTCLPGKFCTEPSISPKGSVLENNVCPDGQICSYATGLTKCPSGFICWQNITLDCTEAVQNSVWRELLIGTTCPPGSDELRMCPAGHYCETPAEDETCPAGYFCMTKSAERWLASSCEQGSKSMCRSGRAVFVGGMTFLAVLFVVINITICCKRRRQKRQSSDASYVPGQTLASMENTVFDVWGTFNRRFHSLQQVNATRSLSNNQEPRMPGWTFSEMVSSEKTFDEILGEEGGNAVTWESVEDALSLTPLQKRRFRYLFRTASGLSDCDKMEKQAFEKHALRAAYQARPVDPTEQEVLDLYEELDRNDDGNLSGDELYNSNLAAFLDDGEINDLVKGFRQRQEKDSGTTPEVGVGILISRACFVEHYKSILEVVVLESSDLSLRGTDIAFQDLCLAVKTANGKTKNVVDHVSGRIMEKKLTALMGGSGAGKTSLLNALCGRAFYGTVSGKIFVNGNEGEINRIKGSIGFVPQDDIVYAELTVRENFLYAGRFRLPRGTSQVKLFDLVDKVTADLGLIRVKNNVVGDVTRRGLSGGEKKRVNIGLELMAQPAVLFLDEPTSGLDSNASLLVMNRLKALTQSQRMTICSVIHQPRKVIFESFDNVVLLNAGGRMVYHGQVKKLHDYFSSMGYVLPPGENVADWMIDISTGDLESESSSASLSMVRRRSVKVSTDHEAVAAEQRGRLNSDWNSFFGMLSESERASYDPPDQYEIERAKPKVYFVYQLWLQLKRRVIVMKGNFSEHLVETIALISAMGLISFLGGKLIPVTNGTVSSGVTLTQLQNSIIPKHETDQHISTFISELCSIVESHEQRILVQNMVEYALAAYPDMGRYGLMLGGVISIMVGINSTKIIRNKRLEFFRESGSGYDIWAFFSAMCIVSTIDYSVQVLLGGLLAIWIRTTMISIGAFLVNVILLAWISSGWGLFYSTWVSPDAVFLVSGCHMVVFLFLSGVVADPFVFKEFYTNPFLNVISGLLAPGRFFIEAYVVGEQKCLKPQSGFTSETLRFLNMTGFEMIGLGQNDPNVSFRSCDGWWWNFIPMFLIGFTLRVIAGGVLHVANRSKMPKTPLLQMFRESRSFLAYSIMYLVIVFGLLALTLSSFLLQRGTQRTQGTQGTHWMQGTPHRRQLVQTEMDFVCGELQLGDGDDMMSCQQMMAGMPNMQDFNDFKSFCSSARASNPKAVV